jgi:hypothetical protein
MTRSPADVFASAIEVLFAKHGTDTALRGKIVAALECEGLDKNGAIAMAGGMILAARAAEVKIDELNAQICELLADLANPPPIPWQPVVVTRCADCEVGTSTINERFMVKQEVWEQAWAGRFKWWQPEMEGQMVLCVGCLEKRIGRELCAADFSDVPINDPHQFLMSERLLDRLRRPSARVDKPVSAADPGDGLCCGPRGLGS